MKSLNTKKIKNNNMVAGAIFDFTGFLTTLEDSISVGTKEDCMVVLDKLKEWASRRGLNLANADVTNWDENI